MEKRKTFHGRQVGKKRLLPIVFPLFLFLLIPLNGYGDDTPMPEVVQQNSTRITGVVKDAYGEPVIGANVKVVGTTQGTITDFEGNILADNPLSDVALNIAALVLFAAAPVFVVLRINRAYKEYVYME